MSVFLGDIHSNQQIFIVTRLAFFNLLVKTKSYNGLIAFAESLEQEGDHKLSDDVLSFVSL